jgi:hypothetical protein
MHAYYTLGRIAPASCITQVSYTVSMRLMLHTQGSVIALGINRCTTNAIKNVIQ